MKEKNTSLLSVAIIVATFLSGCSRSVDERIPAYQAVSGEQVVEIRNALAGGAGEDNTQEVAREEPQGWATLTGTFRFETSAAGQFANPPALEVTGGDADFCGKGGGPKSEAVVVNARNGGLKNVVAYLADDLRKIDKPELWLHEDAAPGKAEPVVFDQKDCRFLTHVLAMQVSQPLQIHNSDGVFHNTYLRNSGTPFNEGIPAGVIKEFTHSKEERAPYSATCSVHPWMKAFILPRNNGYFAVSDEDGSFVIANLPAGVDLTFRFWQESISYIQSVTVNGEKKQWSKRGVVINLPPGKEVKLDVVVDPAAFLN